jgi:hypothetical protein
MMWLIACPFIDSQSHPPPPVDKDRLALFLSDPRAGLPRALIDPPPQTDAAFSSALAQIVASIRKTPPPSSEDAPWTRVRVGALREPAFAAAALKFYADRVFNNPDGTPRELGDVVAICRARKRDNPLHVFLKRRERLVAETPRSGEPSRQFNSAVLELLKHAAYSTSAPQTLFSILLDAGGGLEDGGAGADAAVPISVSKSMREAMFKKLHGGGWGKLEWTALQGVRF